MKNTCVYALRHVWQLCSLLLFRRDPYAGELSHITLEVLAGHICAQNNVRLPSLSDICVPFKYRDPFIQSAVRAAKYHHRKDICLLFGELMWHTFGEDLSTEVLLLGAPWIIIPIPISKRRRQKRGYNQTECIAEGFMRGADSRLFTVASDVLTMTSAHTSQTHVVRKKEREQNIAGSFVVSDSVRITGKNILLIDDVVTTGATLREASRVLQAAGARLVRCCAVAH